MDRFEQFWKWLERRAPWLAEDAARAGKVARGLPRSSKWLVFVALVALVLAWAWRPSCEGDGSVKDVLACSQVNRNYGLMVAGLFALVALYLNWQRTANDRRRTVNDTYVKAVEQLGHAKMEVRFGAIYALERIAATDWDYHWPIMETLCAYIRERPASKWGEDAEAETGRVEALQPADKAGETTKNPLVDKPPVSKAWKPRVKRLPTDIQAILTVFERRSGKWQTCEVTEGLRLDLRDADLRGAVLTTVRLQQADLSGANLSLAFLLHANLSCAFLIGVDLSDSVLSGADLSGAFLINADLTDADLMHADLTGVDLRGAKLSRHPSELGANWDEADPPRNLDKIITGDK